MHTQIVRGLGIRDAPLFDQPYSLKLELPCKLPSLHDTPPVPSKHLTQCLRNRVQARPNTSPPRRLNRKPMPHSMSHSDACLRLFNKKWGIPVYPVCIVC